MPDAGQAPTQEPDEDDISGDQLLDDLRSGGSGALDYLLDRMGYVNREHLGWILRQEGFMHRDDLRARCFNPAPRKAMEKDWLV